MLKKNSLGYIVVSKDKDRYDGWLKIKQGNERGYPAGEEPKTKAAPKEPEKAKTPAAEAAVARRRRQGREGGSIETRFSAIATQRR